MRERGARVRVIGHAQHVQDVREAIQLLPDRGVLTNAGRSPFGVVAAISCASSGPLMPVSSFFKKCRVTAVTLASVRPFGGDAIGPPEPFFWRTVRGTIALPIASPPSRVGGG